MVLTAREEIATRLACALVEANGHSDPLYRIHMSVVAEQSAMLADQIINESEKYFKNARAAGRSA